MTPTFLMRTALTAALALGLAAPVYAQSQAGGLPAANARITALEAATSNLQGQVTALQNANSALAAALAAETAARQAADTTEANARMAGDAAAATNRQNGDAALQAAITEEANARKAADSGLAAQISSSGPKAYSSYKTQAVLVHGEEGTIGTLGPLPDGNYLVVGALTASNFKNNADYDCHLQTSNGLVFAAGTEGTESISTFGGAFGTSEGSLGMTGLVVNPGTISMLCRTVVDGSEMFDVTLVAVQVGSVTIGCPNIRNFNSPTCN